MRIDIITIFPEYLEPLNVSLVGKARARGQLDVRVHDLRAWAHDRHRTVDDTPFGGGPGMVMKPEPWGEALDAVLASAPAARAGVAPDRCDIPGNRPEAPTQAGGAQPAGTPGGGSTDVPGAAFAAGAEVGAAGEPDRGADASPAPTLIVPTPAGRPFTQRVAVELASHPWLVFAPARYEGIDRRVIEEAATRMPVQELSIGDYVLAGGEAAVLVMVEAIARLLPGVLGNAQSHQDDSFAPGPMANLLEGPVYTKPPGWRGREVPEVLLSGHHGKIARWRRDEALRRTAAHRPDLIDRLDPADLDRHDRQLLHSLGWALGASEGRSGRGGPDGGDGTVAMAPRQADEADEGPDRAG